MIEKETSRSIRNKVERVRFEVVKGVKGEVMALLAGKGPCGRGPARLHAHAPTEYSLKEKATAHFLAFFFSLTI